MPLKSPRPQVVLRPDSLLEAVVIGRCLLYKDDSVTRLYYAHVTHPQETWKAKLVACMTDI